MPPKTPSRSTRQRAALNDIMDEIDTFRSAQDIHAALRSRDQGIGLSTVYRTLQVLVETGDVDVVRSEDGEAVYRRCSSGHHHHLVCRDCGRTVEVAGPTIERWTERLAAEHGFTDVNHTIEIFGLCSTCSHGGTAAPARAV